MDNVEQLKLTGVSPTTWHVIQMGGTKCVEIIDYVEDSNNFIELRDIAKVIEWLHRVQAMQGANDG